MFKFSLIFKIKILKVILQKSKDLKFEFEASNEFHNNFKKD